MLASQAFGQDTISHPDREFLFLEDRYEEDRNAERKARITQRKQEIAIKRNPQLPFDISSPNLSFDSVANEVVADGGVAVAYETGVLEATSANINMGTSEAQLVGEVKISDVSGDLIADYAKFNLKSGRAVLGNSEVSFEETGYRIYSEQVRKLEGDTFEFDNVKATTCDCPEEGCDPWSITGSWGKVTKNGYGHLQNMTLRVCGVPIFYFPYVIFPAKTERQTGLLPATFGTGRNNGFEMKLPLFLALDDSADALVTGVVQTETRYGLDTEFRKIFRRGRKLHAGFTFLDESARGGELQGTIVEGFDDPTIDEDRYLAFLDFSGSWEPGISLVVDGNYVSDDLVLREYNKSQIGEFNDRFVTSDVVLRAALPLSMRLSISGEYNQAIVTDDDFVFQRAPEVSVSGGDTYLPFGESQYGLQLIAQQNVSFVNFLRDRSFEGRRSEFFHRSILPYYYKNYLEGALEFDARATHYGLGERAIEAVTVAEDGTETIEETGRLNSSEVRFVPSIKAEIGTVVEKVYEASSLSRFLLDLGPRSRLEQAKRLKHTIEPELSYKFVPDIDQEDNPIFDSTDRLAERSVVSYGVTQRLFTRYELQDPYALGIKEVAPEVEDLKPLSSRSLFDDSFGSSGTYSGFSGLEGLVDTGTVREVASFRVYQSYDLVEARDDLIEDRNGLSDLGLEFNFIPNYHFRFGAESNLDIENGGFSSYAIRGQFLDKYGDELRVRFSSVEDQLRQVESSLQLSVLERVKLGFYTRFDDLEGEFIENRVGIRLLSSCNCWYLDADIRDSTNPNETRFGLNVTFKGLGQFGNSFLTDEEEL